MWLLLAQEVPRLPDPLSGGSGWVGAGLLGVVLGWLLLRHLPDKDKQLMTLVESRDGLVEKLAAKHESHITLLENGHTAHVKDIIDATQKQLAQVIDHCHRETEATVGAVQDGLNNLHSVVLELTRAVNDLNNRGRTTRRRSQDPPSGGPVP